MSQDNKKSMVMYQGDGSNNVFAVPMTKGKYGTISVAFVRRGLDNYEYNPTTWTLNDENTLLTWTGDVLNVGDYIVIERTTVRKQPYEFPNNQKHIERSDDNLERQIQEVADAADRALKLDPTYSIDSDKMNPIEWLQTIVRCKDLTVRGLRFVNNVLQYSKDDPEKPESEKTWYSLLNTDGITNVRERYDVGTDTYYFEYSTDGGSNWKDVGEMIRHNGLQGRDEADCHPISAITGLQDKLSEKLNTESAEETYATKTELSSHTENTDNPHNVTKAQVGLGNVDNTSDLSKPISTATQNALNGKLSIKQNPQDAGKVVKVGSDGNLEFSSESSGGGLQSVSHGATLKGAGTDSQPLDVADGSIGNTQLAEEVKQEIAGKQPAGNYATEEELVQGLEGKQPTGDYATNTALQQGLATKQDKLGFATATTAGIVRVGSGSQMVVNPTTGDISLDGTKAESIRGTIGALASNQGSSNSGLILGIDADGDVVPTESSSGGRNIGDIFWTTRTDSALNGAVEANGAQYNFADVNQGQNNVQTLLESGKLSYVSIADYESAISSKGWCDKIGYDSGSASFRVPKLTPYIVQKENIPVIGNGTSLGLYNGNNPFSLVRQNAIANNAIITKNAAYNTTVGTASGGGSGDFAGVNYSSIGVVTDPEKSGIIANLSSVASIGRIMIQLFNSATDEAVATCTSVLQDVANLNMGDYVIYWDSGDATDHSHAKPGVATPASGTWYRLYKSGWVEQGGVVGNPNGICISVTLPIGMMNDSFTAIVSGNTSGILENYTAITCERQSSTQIAICTTGQQGNGCSWRVEGYAA